MLKCCFLVLLSTALLAISCIATASCVATKSSGEIQWSERSSIVSPNHVWRLEVHPNLASDDNESPVAVVNCKTNASYPIFVLDRMAYSYWSPNGDNLVIINESGVDVYNVLFFDIKSSSTFNPSQTFNVLNKKIENVIFNKLGKNRFVHFYLPTFVSWTDGELVLAVGGATTSPGAYGPMTPYCFGIVVDTGTQNIKSVVSADELKHEFSNTECRVSP